jgi:hypothetical protein
MQQRGSLEAILETLPHPDNFTYQAARDIFLHPPVISAQQLDRLWTTDEADPKALDDFLRRRVGWRRR